MAQTNNPGGTVTLGAAPNGFAADSRVFIVNQGGVTTLGASGTNITTNQPLTVTQQFDANDCVIKCQGFGRPANADTTVVTLNGVTLQMQNPDTANGGLNVNTTTLNDVDIIATQAVGTGDTFWGLYGPASEAGRERTWTLNNVRFLGRPEELTRFYAIINGIAPDSVINNVQFVNADGTLGAYSERPFADFTDTVIGDFVRELPGGGTEEAWFSFTGGFQRENRDITTGWVISANEDASNIIMNTERVIGVDGNVNLWLPNFYLPTFNTNQVMLVRRQSSFSPAQTDNGRAVTGTTWNPVYVDSDDQPVVNWRFFATEVLGLAPTVYGMPATKSNAPGANDVPTALTVDQDNSLVYSEIANNNGFFIQERIETINTLNPGTPLYVNNYSEKNFRIYDFKTQTGDEIGQEITLTGPPQGMNRAEWIAAATNDADRTFRESALQEMTKDGETIGYRHQDSRVFTVDLNIPTALDEATAILREDATVNDYNNIYGTFKAWYNSENEAGQNPPRSWPLGETPGSIVVDRTATWGTTPSLLNTRLTVAASTTFDALDANATINTWDTNTQLTNLGDRILPSGITLACDTSGQYSNYAHQGAATNVNFRGMVALNLTGAGGNFEIEEVLGTYTVADATTRIILNAANPLTLTLTEAQALNFGLTINPGDSTTPAGGNVTFMVPAAPVADANLSFNGPATGFFVIKIQGTPGILSLIDLANDTYDQNDLIPDQNVQTTTIYDTWYIPASTVAGVDGATDNTIYDFTYAEWRPTNGSLAVLPTQLDPDGVLVTGLTATAYNASNVLTSVVLDAGVAQYTIVSAATTYSAEEASGIAVKVLQSELYIMAVATANLNNSERVIVFGQALTIIFNGGNIVTDRELIRFNSTGQRTIGGASGFASTVAGTSPDTFDTVIAASLITPTATLDSVQGALDASMTGSIIMAAQESKTGFLRPNSPTI